MIVIAAFSVLVVSNARPSDTVCHVLLAVDDSKLTILVSWNASRHQFCANIYTRSSQAAVRVKKYNRIGTRYHV